VVGLILQRFRKEIAMNLAGICQELIESLGLTRSPVALSFLDQPPKGVDTIEAAVPSACTFWIKAEQGLFFARAKSHQNCPIGAVTMGFPISAQTRSNLETFASQMYNVSYLGLEEIKNIPRVEVVSTGILYGPLSIFPVQPDLVMVWTNGQQAMILQETLGTVYWNTAQQSLVSGRPTCAALALAINEGLPKVSLGCTGMRTFTEVSNEYLLVALPGGKLETLSEHMRRTLKANEQMSTFYQAHKSTFSDP